MTSTRRSARPETNAAPAGSIRTQQAGRPTGLLSLLRRRPDLEPTGRWLAGRSDMAWPDAMVSDWTVRWSLRGLLVVTVAICAVTAPQIVGWPAFGRLVVLSAAVAAWFEWWTRWDLTPLSRRVIAFAVQWAVMAAMVWTDPLAAVYAFAGYLLAGTLFSGWRQVLGVFGTAAVVAASQVGGQRQISGDVGLYIGLILVNFLIALAFVTLSNRREDAIRKRDAANRELLTAQQANLALQEQLVDQARVAGIRDERARLARDLHDTVAQGLVAVVTQLESIDDRHVDPDTRQRVDSAKALARQSLAEARRAVHALSPTDLDDRTLPDAMRAIVSAWSARNRIPARLHTSGDERASVSDDDLIKVCHETLSNVARHAQARSVAVTLTYLDDQVLMDIRDDGRGFDSTALSTPRADGGHGLVGMRDRLQLAGGDLVVESEPGAGCVVSAVLPVDGGYVTGTAAAAGTRPVQRSMSDERTDR